MFYSINSFYIAIIVLPTVRPLGPNNQQLRFFNVKIKRPTPTNNSIIACTRRTPQHKSANAQDGALF